MYKPEIAFPSKTNLIYLKTNSFVGSFIIQDADSLNSYTSSQIQMYGTVLYIYNKRQIQTSFKVSFLFSKQLLFQGAKHRIYIFQNFFSFFLKIFLLPHTRIAQPCDILCGNRNSAVRRFFVSVVCISKNFAVCTKFVFFRF